ncbi:MAG TPA: hypothetical protein IAA53_09880 [Candidatus Avoscillospira avicola]|uniref:DUF4358 domain-containing protein n=1 Tax=Candidatus Avoscillospira avicola TaxID=2840706 RepID=A0A9D1DJ22_9FIRM|nr:hypothetical protein [Candidatus Avoscillospira avicola]
MKKLIALLLVLTMALSLAACAKKPAEDTTEDETITDTENTTEDTTEDTAEDTTEDATEGTEETQEPEAQEPADPDADVPATPDVDPETPATPEEPVDDGGAAVNPGDTATELTAEEQEVLDTLQQLVAGAADEIMCDNVIISADQYPYYLFIDYIDGSIAASASAMIGSIAHSVVLLKLPADADVAAVAADIEANLDPRKWICVEAEATLVKTSGQYVLMAMSSQDIVDAISANFDTVFGA